MARSGGAPVKSILALGLTLTMLSTSPALAEDPPAALLLDANALLQVRSAARAGDPAVESQLAALRSRADAALSRPPRSVTEKHVPPPSGDVHDYVSLSIYWWPDPAKPSGLPYIQRDGVRNTEADDTSRYDASPLSRMVSDVEMLSLAYYLTGDERYGRHATTLLGTWFLDPATRMNPNFRFAQIIPGRDAIRGTGIIESRRFTRIVDSIVLLQDCSCFSPSDQAGLRAWFHDFADWLRTSPHGQLEARTTNNHAVWYDVQLVDFELFAGDRDAAIQTLSAVPQDRIAAQIADDGSMPGELERTRSLHYSNFNLQAFAELATLAQQVDIDLWNLTSPETRASIRNAIDFLIPYMTDPNSWPYDEITDVNIFVENAQTLIRAARAYPDSAYGDVLTQLTTGQSTYDLFRLQLGLWPD